MRGTAEVFNADGTTIIIDLTSEPDVELLQSIVGGYLEEIPEWNKKTDAADCIAYCNDEGTIQDLPRNARVSERLGRVIYGNVVLLYGDKAFMDSL